MNPLLQLYMTLADKVKDSASSNVQFSMQQPAPPPMPDPAVTLQNTAGQAGIDNEAVSYLRPSMPSSFVNIPQLPVQQVQPQMTERERYLESEMRRIQEGRPPPALL